MSTYPISSMVAHRDAFGHALVEFADRYPDLVVFDSDVCTSTKTSLFREAYPERFYQMGIAESNMVGVAAGLSSLGCTPFVSTFAVFLAKRAIDQIRVSVAIAQANVKLNGAYGGLPTGRAGATHSSVEDIAVMRSMPNMRVLVPADAVETRLAVQLALDTKGPVYLRTVRCPVKVVFPEDHTLSWGEATILAQGNDVALISTGMMTPKALHSCRKLQKKGISVRHIHMPSIKPLDESVIIAAAKECGLIVTVENHSIIGGLGSAVTEVVTQHHPCKVERIGFPDIFMESGDDEAIFSSLGMNVDEIASSVMYLMDSNRLSYQENLKCI